MRVKSLFTILVSLTFIFMFGITSSILSVDTYYYVLQNAPNDEGIPNGDPSDPENCWQTISKAFADLRSNNIEGTIATIAGKGNFIIQVQDTAIYQESVVLNGLTTTDIDTLTLRKDPNLSERPTINATNQSGPAINITTVAYVTIEGFTLKANQTLYRILRHDQTGLNDGLLTVRDNVFDGQGVGNDQGDQCAQLQVMPMRVNTIISGNEFKNCYDNDDSCPLLTVYTDTTGGELSSVPEVIISDNVFHDNIVNAVIYNSDDYVHTGVIEGNRIYNNRLPATSGRNQGGVIMFHINDGPMIVRNNLVYNNDWSNLPNRAAIYCWGSDNKKIYNNTLYNNNTSGGNILVDANSSAGIEVKNNIIYPSPKNYCIYLEAGAEAGFTSAKNLFYSDFDNDGVCNSAKDYVAYKKTGPGKKQFVQYLLFNWRSTYESSPDYTIYGNPIFASINPIDLHIIPPSPCINGGIYLADVADDIDGNPRTYGNYDIGADEFIISDTTPPASVTNLTPGSPTANSIGLSWTAPGDDGTDGTASSYDIRYSTSIINSETAWNAANQCANEPAPGPSGTPQSFTVTGLSPNTTYYFAIKTADEVNNWSELSNSPNGATTGSGTQIMHVFDITMSLKYAGLKVNARAVVTIVDTIGTPVSGATVYGIWSGRTSDSDSGVTDTTGKVTLNSDAVKNPPPGTTFTFTVTNVARAGWTYNSGANVETSDSISIPSSAPAGVYINSLGNAYPSFANPETWIPFTLSEQEHVFIRIYSVAGNLVRTLDMGQRSPGDYISREKAAYWDGKSESGDFVSSGIYFYTIQAGNFTATKKLVIAR